MYIHTSVSIRCVIHQEGNESYSNLLTEYGNNYASQLRDHLLDHIIVNCKDVAGRNPP